MASLLAQVGIDVHEARPRDDALPGDPAETRPQPAQQPVLGLVAWREIGVPSLGRERVMPASIPEQTGLPEAGAGGNDSGIAAGAGRPRGENQQVLRSQRRETPG